MYENIFAWVGLGLIFILCLPVPSLQRFLLTVYGLALRLGMLALVAAAGYLWFYPAQLPTVVADVVNQTPLLKSILSEPGTPVFGICALALIAVVVLPLIAIIDVCRRNVARPVTVTVSEPAPIREAVYIPEAQIAPAPQQQRPVTSRFGRRAAANTIAHVGSTS